MAVIRIVTFAMLCVWPVMLAAQPDLAVPGRAFVTLGAQFAAESDGTAGAGVGFELNFANLSKTVSIGGGGSVGVRQSRFRGILGVDYTLQVIPVLGFMHAHWRPPAVPRLDLFGGPVAGASRFRLRDAQCAGSSDCRTEIDNLLSAGVQTGMFVALTKRTAAWVQLSAGRNLPSATVGFARIF